MLPVFCKSEKRGDKSGGPYPVFYCTGVSQEEQLLNVGYISDDQGGSLNSVSIFSLNNIFESRINYCFPLIQFNHFKTDVFRKEFVLSFKLYCNNGVWKVIMLNKFHCQEVLMLISQCSGDVCV